ncbi:MAG: hypothetical protein U9Q81_14915 [Pseudomonadota bacterium]|nr:hypothetical protein [Pseudomonadota bacterium]
MSRVRLHHILIPLVLAALPTLLLLASHSGEHGFLSLIRFGNDFEPGSLQEVRALDPPRVTAEGYDGQFYAQMALNPTLTREDLGAAIDNPGYRSVRIGLPLLASWLGFGNAEAVLQVYAVLNYLFWMLLLVGFYAFQRPETGKDFLLLFAVLWSSGTLLSVSFTLTDLPAAVLCMYALWLRRHPLAASSILGYAALVKETSLLGAFSLMSREAFRETPLWKILSAAGIAVLPVLLWYLYVKHRFPTEGISGAFAFTWPFAGIVRQFGTIPGNLRSGSGIGILKAGMELTALTSLSAQALYLLAKPRYEFAPWRLGIGFALLFLCFSPFVLVSWYSYCRSVLLMTFAFNLVIHRFETGSRFYLWFTLGNVGLAWGIGRVLYDSFWHRAL